MRLVPLSRFSRHPFQRSGITYFVLLFHRLLYFFSFFFPRKCLSLVLRQPSILLISVGPARRAPMSLECWRCRHGFTLTEYVSSLGERCIVINDMFRCVVLFFLRLLFVAGTMGRALGSVTWQEGDECDPFFTQFLRVTWVGRKLWTLDLFWKCVSDNFWYLGWAFRGQQFLILRLRIILWWEHRISVSCREIKTEDFKKPCKLFLYVRSIRFHRQCFWFHILTQEGKNLLKKGRKYFLTNRK